MFCSKCGFKMEDGDKFCRSCGALSTIGGSGSTEDSHIISPNSAGNDETGIEVSYKDEAPVSEEMQIIYSKAKMTPRKGAPGKLIIAIMIGLILLVGGVFFVKNSITRASVKEAISLGNKYVEDGKYEEAILALKKVIEIEPKNIEVRFIMADAYKKLDKPDEAEKTLKDIIAIDKGNAQAYLNLGDLFAGLDRMEDAVLILQQGYDKIGDTKIKELLDELLGERANGGIISDRVGDRIINEYMGAKTYHYKGTVTTLKGGKVISKLEIETWIVDDKLRTDFYSDGKFLRTLLVKDDKPVFYNYEGKAKHYPNLDAGHYFASYIMPDKAVLKGKDEESKALVYNLDINKTYDKQDVYNQWFVKNINYYVSRQGVIRIKSFSGADETDISEHDYIFTDVEYNKVFDDEIFKEPF